MKIQIFLILSTIFIVAFATPTHASLKIGVSPDFPPYEYLTSSGAVAGYDIDVGIALCDKLKQSCQWIPTEFPQLSAKLATGEIDMIISSYSLKPHPNDQVDKSDFFSSNPIYVDEKTGEPLGVVLKKDQSILRDNINDALQELLVSGELNRLAQRHSIPIAQLPPKMNPADGSHFAKIEKSRESELSVSINSGACPVGPSNGNGFKYPPLVEKIYSKLQLDNLMNQLESCAARYGNNIDFSELRELKERSQPNAFSGPIPDELWCRTQGAGRGYSVSDAQEVLSYTDERLQAYRCHQALGWPSASDYAASAPTTTPSSSDRTISTSSSAAFPGTQSGKGGQEIDSDETQAILRQSTERYASAHAGMRSKFGQRAPYADIKCVRMLDNQKDTVFPTQFQNVCNIPIKILFCSAKPNQVAGKCNPKVTAAWGMSNQLEPGENYPFVRGFSGPWQVRIYVCDMTNSDRLCVLPK